MATRWDSKFFLIVQHNQQRIFVPIKFQNGFLSQIKPNSEDQKKILNKQKGFDSSDTWKSKIGKPCQRSNIDGNWSQRPRF